MLCSRPNPSALVPGDTIGRYVIVRPLGQGAAGCVYEAHDPGLDRRVALKLLHDCGADPDALLREARGLARVDHPNVVSIHELGEDRGQVFVAMELVRGQTLAEWIRRAQPTWREVVRLMKEAGAGIAAVHAAGLVHRDFKPSNVLVGKDGRVRVADFGLVRPSRAPGRDFTVEVADGRSRTDSDIAGTPAYMPPEAFDGLRLGAEMDVWAFAVVLFEAVAGVHPFSARHTAEYLARIHRGDLRWERSDKRVPVQLRRALGRWLHADRSRRPASIEIVLAELDDIVRPRRRLSTATALLAVLVAPWFATSLATSATDSSPKICTSH